MVHIETLFLTLSTLIILSIVIARLTNNIGVPVLLLFLGIGMLAGSEGPGGIYFDDPAIAQTIGIVSLVFILFSGGLDTNWNSVKSVVGPALSLSTFGVALTAVAVGGFTTLLFDVPILVSLLLGSIVASTDAAAVFSIIGARNIKLKGKITPLLELESGSNDPMAVFLTVSLIEIIRAGDLSIGYLIWSFVKQMGIGLVVGLALGNGMVFVINKLRFPIEGFYAVFVLAGAFFVYSLTTLLDGSGFLAVYLAGMVVGSSTIVYKKNIFRFFDGMAWVAQIIMFLSLGLLVFPSQILPTIEAEMLISLFLIFIARPVGVFLSLLPFKFSIRQKIFVSWVGLRGAVPIVLATFPMIEGVKEAQWIFNIVFFIVLTSALLQGWTIPIISRKLKLEASKKVLLTSPAEFNYLDRIDRVLVRFAVPDSPAFKNKPIVEIKSLRGSLIVLVKRGNTYFVPSGGTILQVNDELQALVEASKFDELQNLLERETSSGESVQKI